MNAAVYRIESDTPDYVIIRDVGPWNQHGTVTNEAERVVTELVPMLRGRRLFYYDSAGDLDELVIRNGKFAGWRAGGPGTELNFNAPFRRA